MVWVRGQRLVGCNQIWTRGFDAIESVVRKADEWLNTAQLEGLDQGART